MATRLGINLKIVFAAVFVVLLFAVAVSVKPAHAANPTTMSFQGKVVNSNGTNVTDGTYTFVFKFYTVSSGGSALWTETDSLAVSGGVFQVNLGAVCPLFTANACNSSTPLDFNANPNMYLGITFNADPAGEMSPRVQLQSVPYAFNADKVGGLSASQFVQLSPGSQQTGNINVSGTTTSATSVVTPLLSATGALIINSGTDNNITIDEAASGTSAINIGGTNATSIGLSRSGQTTTVNGALSVTQNATFNSNVVMTFSGTENMSVTTDLAGNVSAINVTATPSTTAGTTNGVQVSQAASANTNGLDSGFTVDNNNTSLAITNAFDINNTGGGGYTNYFSAPNYTLNGNGEMIGKGFDYFDPARLTGTTTVGTGGATTGNFGGAFSSGAFMATTDMYSQEFVSSRASSATNNSVVGDDGKWYFNNTGTANPSTQTFSPTGGYIRLVMANTAGRGGLIAEGTTGGTLDAPINAANLPIVQMKVRPSATTATDDFFWGAATTAAAATTNDPLPANGIFFWSANGTGATGWQGMVRSGSATIGTVNCPGTVTVNQFATGRIVVVNATNVRFFIDNNASDGVNFTDCGTVTGALPTVDLAMEMFVAKTGTGASNFDMDYARFWQDDAQVTTPIAPTQTVTLDASTPDTTTASADTTTDTSSDKIVTVNGQQIATVDANGNATFSGSISASSVAIVNGLTVGGDSSFAGLSTFQKLATFLAKTVFKQDVSFEGHVTVSSDSAGYAKFSNGDQTVHVGFAKSYEDIPIVSISSSDGQFVQASVKNVTAQGFDVVLQAPAVGDMTYSWIAVGAVNPQTAQSTASGQ